MRNIAYRLLSLELLYNLIGFSLPGVQVKQDDMLVAVIGFGHHGEER